MKKLKDIRLTGSLSNGVTVREIENRKLARTAAAEGFVLLKNEGKVLPLKKESKVALYGMGAVKTIKGGTGSGDVNERDCVNIYEGFLNAGYQVTNMDWIKETAEIYVKSREDWKAEILRKLPEYDNVFFNAYANTPYVLPAGAEIQEEIAKADGADVALFVLSRIAGEGADRHDNEGDYYITKEEMALLKKVSACYEKVILAVNTGGLVDLAFTEEISNLFAIIQFMQAGQEGGNALADVVSGDVSPSGKMTDSWAMTYGDYPNADFFSHKSGDVFKEEYKENIYVGYRYFDTFDVPVRYCFGYGLSYTDFAIHTGAISVSGMGTASPRAEVTVEVQNIGDTYAGKEVVQIYVACPQGNLPKEYRRLAAFAKTRTLKPGETQKMSISFPLYQLASYCEKCASWILEGGIYGIFVGNSIEDAKLVGSLKLDETAVMVKCTNICPMKEEMEELKADPEKMQAKAEALKAAAEQLPCVEIKASEILTETISYAGVPETFEGEAGEIVETMTLEELIALSAGDPGKGQGSALGSAGQSVPGAAAEIMRMEEKNIGGIVLADGPAGLRLNQEYQVVDGVIQKMDFLHSIEGGFFAEPIEKKGTTYYQFCTAVPVGTLLAQTWNVDLIKEIGEMIGKEMELFNVTLWLAPGMNIHRNPLCGRNFEYYSEDPLLSGMMAGAMTIGVQKVPGCGTTIKHYATNNQEDNRMGSDTIISERTLREIYLKGFEIAVKDAQPMSIMTSYNLINGVHAANCYDTCTKAARDEWGFKGAIMTDWTTTTNSTAGICNAAGCMRAGNDMVMPGDPSDAESIRKEIAEGTLSMNELKRCITNTVNIILQSNQYEEAESYLKQFEGLDTYIQVK